MQVTEIKVEVLGLKISTERSYLKSESLLAILDSPLYM